MRSLTNSDSDVLVDHLIKLAGRVAEHVGPGCACSVDRHID